MPHTDRFIQAALSASRALTPGRTPMPPDTPDTTMPREDMLAVRERVRAQLLRDYHSYTLTARLYHNVDNIPYARFETARATECLAMLRNLAEEPEPAHGTAIRIHDVEQADPGDQDGS